MRKILTVIVLVGIIAAACYSLDLFDRSDTIEVKNEKYPTGGFVYSGALKDGYPVGEGEIIFANGDRYYGGFLDGRFDGDGIYEGVMRYADKDEEYKWRLVGFFSDGQLSKGEFYYDGRDDSPATYEKTEQVNLFSFEGWTFEGLLDVTGQNGLGKFIFGDGTIYEGNFSHGFADGEGTLSSANGQTTYHGNFKAGLFDGDGTVTIDGKSVRGVWEAGVQIKRYE